MGVDLTLILRSHFSSLSSLRLAPSVLQLIPLTQTHLSSRLPPVATTTSRPDLFPAKSLSSATCRSRSTALPSSGHAAIPAEKVTCTEAPFGSATCVSRSDSADRLEFDARVFERGFREQDRELFAAEARDEIARAHRRSQHLGDPAEHDVARGMAVRIVDMFEVIDVEHRDRQAAARCAPCARFPGARARGNSRGSRAS